MKIFFFFTSPLLSTNNLILHTTLVIFLTLSLSFLKIPIFFLQGLNTYIHPDDVTTPNPTSTNGIRAAIRRPGSSDPEPKPRKKSKDKFEFDENKAQIFRLRLTDGHLQTRIYFDSFRIAFNWTLISLASLALLNSLSVSEDSGIISNGSVIPILLGLATVIRLFTLIARVSLEKSASKRSEKQLSVVLGFLGFVLGLLIVFEIVPNWVLDFGFRSLDGFVKFLVAALMGCVSGFLYMPAARGARAFWLGTDQIRCNLSIIYGGWFARLLLYSNYLLFTFTSLLWIRPLADLLVDKNAETNNRDLHNLHLIGNVDELVGNLGMSKLDFDKFKVWCLLISGVLQIVTLRPNLQMYLNEAVLSWYQRLHASKVPDMDFSRAKVFLHNHYLCLVVLQFFVPPGLVLLFLGLSQIDESLFKNLQPLCSSFPCSAFVKEIALFMAWWIVFVWAIFTSATLVLYRRGISYVS